MIWLPFLALGASVFGSRFGTCESGWCYDEGKICWLDDKAPECPDELYRIAQLAQSGPKQYRQDPVKTVASYLNRSFIRPAYRGRDFLVEKAYTRGARTRVYVSFDDSTHMGFELERLSYCGCSDIWVVRRYAYLDENPFRCCN